MKFCRKLALSDLEKNRIKKEDKEHVMSVRCSEAKTNYSVGRKSQVLLLIPF